MLTGRMRVLVWIAWIVLAAVSFLWFAWIAGTLWFANIESVAVRGLFTLAWVILVAVLFLRVRPARRALFVALVASVPLALVYVLVRPSNDREWQRDVAVAPTVDIQGDRVTVRAVRNFHYRSETDFDPVWEDRSYDLSKLRTLDLLMSYWGPVDYCHTFVSFGFEGGEQLACSVETRKEIGEDFSTLGGLFKRFELIYVFADERDLIGLRTNHRGESVYLYRVRACPDRLRQLFLSYLRKADELARSPEFYGVLRNSCGVNILHRVAESGKTVLMGRDALLNGYWDESLYAHGALDAHVPFEKLREMSRVDEKAKAAGESAEFSRAIRVGLPSAPPCD
jgi:hypothetical protein